MEFKTEEIQVQNTLQAYKELFSDVKDYDPTGFRRMLFEGEVEAVKTRIELGENEIPIGFSSFKFTIENLVTLTLNFKTKVSFLVIGKNRTGKSVTSAMMIDNIFLKFKSLNKRIKILGLDSKKELFTHKMPFAFNKEPYWQEKYDSFFELYGLKRFGYKMLCIRPKFLGEVPNVDKYYTLTYPDFKQLLITNKQDAVTILIELLGLEANPNNVSLILRAVADLTITTWQGLYDRMRKFSPSKKEVQDDEEAKLVGTSARTAFREIKAGLEIGYLSDNPDDRFNVLEAYSEYDFINFVGDIRSSKDDNPFTIKYNAYVKMLVTQVMKDVERYRQGSPDTYIKGDILLWIPEVDSLVPKEGNSSLKAMVTQSITKLGSFGVHTVIDVQQIDRIDPSVFRESSIISSRADEENLKMIENKGVNEETVAKFRSLAMKKETSVGTRASLFGFLYEDTLPVFAFPFPSCSAFFAEEINTITMVK